MDRETILTELHNVILDSDVAKGLSRQFEGERNIRADSFPYLIIEDDGPETIEYKTGGLADVLFEVNLIGYVKAKENLSTAINDFDVEIKKVIAGSDKINQMAFGVEILALADRSGTELRPFGRFVRPIKIMYEGVVADGL